METRETKTSSTNTSKNTFDNQLLTYIEPMPSEFREWLVTKWNLVKDAMTVSEVADLTGYSETTIKEWIAKKELTAVLSQTKQTIAKEWLLDFYLFNSYNNRWKSNKHGTTSNEQRTQTEYIRHQIHHPENTHNPRFSDEELRVSIEMMRAFIQSQSSNP